MSDMVDFAKLVLADEELQDEVFSFLAKFHGKEITDEAVEKVLALAKARDFDVTKEEVRAYLSDEPIRISDEVMEEVLMK